MIIFRLLVSVFISVFAILPLGIVAWLGYLYLNGDSNHRILAWLLDELIGVACYLVTYLVTQVLFAFAAAFLWHLLWRDPKTKIETENP